LIDDSDDAAAWVPESSAAELWRCSHLDGCAEKGVIAKHVQRGYEWADERGADFIVNFDADLLLVDAFFLRMFEKYSEARCMTPILTGYTSSTHLQSYGANYLFDRFTYRTIVRSSFSPKHQAQRSSETDWGGNIAWDEHMIGEYKYFCQETIWRPQASLLYHVNSNDALHLNLKEFGVDFPLDEFNKALLTSDAVKSYLVKAYDGELESEKLPLAPTSKELRDGTVRTCKVSPYYALHGEGVASVKVIAVEQCCLRCLEEAKCKTFSYNEHTKMCDMKGTEVREVETDQEPNMAGWGFSTRPALVGHAPG